MDIAKLLRRVSRLAVGGPLLCAATVTVAQEPPKPPQIVFETNLGGEMQKAMRELFDSEFENATASAS